jgi:hypothetical protein
MISDDFELAVTVLVCPRATSAPLLDEIPV